MRKRPILSFVLCISSGFIDSFDGDLARYYGQTSKIGYLLDVGMDRLTNFAQMFVLGTIFKKYWLIFFSIAFVEILKDFAGSFLNIYRLKLDLLVKLNQQTNSDLSFLRQDILREMGLHNIDLVISSHSGANVIESSFTWCYVLFQALQPYIWYTSDTFYWLIYFASFVPSHNPQFNYSRKHSAHLLPLNPENTNHSYKETLWKRLFLDLNNLFDDCSVFLESKFRELKITSRLSDSVKLKLTMRLVGYCCLLGALLKFYLNFQTLFFNFVDVINLDTRVNQFKLDK
jgi:hypothetical protein